MIPPLPALSCTAPPPGLVKHKHRETINKGNVGRMPRRGVPRRNRAPGKCSLSLSFSLDLLFFTRISDRCGSPRVKPRWLCGSLFTGHHHCGSLEEGSKSATAYARFAPPSRRLPALLDIAPSCFRLFVSTYRGNFGESAEPAERTKWYWLFGRFGFCEFARLFAVISCQRLTRRFAITVSSRLFCSPKWRSLFRFG